MASIKHLLAMKIKELLTASCVTAIPDDDPTKVEEIVLRKMTGAPRLGLVVMNFDPLLLEGRGDKIVSARQFATDGLNYPPRESTGATNDRIDGTVEIIANLTRTKEDTEEADEIIQEVIARVEYTLRTHRADFRAIPQDSYNRFIYDFTIVDTMEYDSGAKSANTTRSFVRWTAIVHSGTGR